jgi:pimeloyl-ACP methyl ester carboxylesterase
MNQRTSSPVELHVLRRGQGVPLLLVHGFPLDHRMWHAQIDALADEFNVLAPDLRGFGRSPGLPGTVTMAELADDVAAALDRLEIRQPVHFCGLSMGGYVAWQFWARHRERLASLILCDTKAVGDTEEGAKGRHAMSLKVLQEGSESIVEPMLEKLISPHSRQHKPEVVARLRQMISESSPQAIASVLGGMAVREDMTGRLAEVDVPTQLIVGRHDAISPVEEMRSIAAGMSGEKFQVIDHAGHMTPMENPQEFNQTVREFLHGLRS